MLSKYQKIGLRQDKNLSDLDNKSLALDNLLNNLSDNFNGQDVKTALDGLRNTDVTLEDIYNLEGLAVTDSNDEPVPQIVTIQDHINNYRVFSGNPAFASGGQGMPARFIPGADTVSDFSNPAIKGSALYTTLANSQIEYNWWDDGYFSFDTKVHPFLSDQFGLVQWEGYAGNLPDYMYLRTSGFFLIETNVYEDDDTPSPSNWVTQAYLLNVRRSFVTNKASSIVESTWSPQVNTGYGVGDRLVELNSVDVFDENITITDIDEDTGVITLSTAVQFVAGNNTLVFEFNFGNEPITSLFRTPQTAIGQRVKVRFSVWWPNPATTSTNCFNGQKFTVTGPLGNRFARKEAEFTRGDSSWCHYSHFYENHIRNDDILSITNAGKESFEEFYKGALSMRAPRIQQKNFISEQTFTLDITPKFNVSDNIITIVGGFIKTSPNRLEGDFTQAEEGDLLVLPGQNIVVIAQKENNNAVYVNDFDGALTDTIYSTVTLVKAYGLIGVFDWVSSGTGYVNVSNNFALGGATSFPPSYYSDTSKIKTDMFVHTDVAGNVARITDVTLVTSTSARIYWGNFHGRVANIGTGTTGLVFVYARRGLEDSTNAQKCEGVSYVELSATSSAGGNTFTVLDASSANIGDYVQFSGIIESKFAGNANDTTITNKVGNTLTISRPLIANLSVGFAVTVIPASKFNTVTPTDYEICTIPPNTAPPFEGTDAGLKTNNTESTSNYKLLTSNIKTNKLTLKNTTVTTETAPSPTYSEKIKISNGLQNYYLLIK